MPSNFTENYSLSQWERTDKVQMEDFNEDNAKIDAALAGLAASRNCQAYYTTYVGTGTAGASYPNRMTFPHKPLFVYVIGNWGSCLAMVQGHIYANRPSGRRNIITWGGNSVSWYEDNNGFAASATDQCNTSGETYCVFAILELED